LAKAAAQARARYAKNPEPIRRRAREQAAIAREIAQMAKDRNPA
jgi:hypothetical protein